MTRTDSTIAPELLAPAGDLEKLESAIAYGADAVYLGGERFGLRALAGNFPLADLRRAREITRDAGKRLYLTLNAFLRPGDVAPFGEYLEALRPLDLDAYIVSDPGAVALVRRLDPQREIHLSTQANTTNPEAVRFWLAAGVRRINLARELTLQEMAQIRQETGAEIEAFVHGAQCVAWSGRCLLSAALTGRSANEGACAQACRWRYALHEETRPGEFFPIEEDERGTYLLNSRDLCLIEHLPELLAAGVSALKIEGRMKSRYYVAAVTRVYRAALDSWLADPQGYRFDPTWRSELEKVSHRPYDRGFLYGGRDPLVHRCDSRYRRTYDFVAVVERLLPGNRGVVVGRNRFFPGEELELIGPAMRQATFRAASLATEDGAALPVAQPNARAVLALPASARPGDMLRREKDAK
ncbi:MAG: U32 family peptidase [Desulfuromonadales bacterium]